MTVLMNDVYETLGNAAKESAILGLLSDIVYAVDTLIVGNSAKCVEKLAKAIETAGAEYGMSLHLGKTQALSVCTSERLCKPDGTFIEGDESMIYLGGLLARDGRSDSELSRRIGLASSEFRLLAKVWSHAGLSRRLKLDYFQAGVVSKLQYGLCTTTLVKSQRRRLDGFYCKCIRRILGIPAAYYSRLSNSEVLKRASLVPFTSQLLYHQLLLLGRIGRSPPDNPLRKKYFHWKYRSATSGTLRPPHREATAGLDFPSTRRSRAAVRQQRSYDACPAGHDSWSRTKMENCLRGSFSVVVEVFVPPLSILLFCLFIIPFNILVIIREKLFPASTVF
jgi:hypothetical protein